MTNMTHFGLASVAPRKPAALAVCRFAGTQTA
jgi:hypothetical protein